MGSAAGRRLAEDDRIGGGVEDPAVAAWAIEPLEVRALLSGETVQLIKDVNTVESYPADLTPAGSNLFYLVKDSIGTGVDLMVTNAGGTQVLGDSGGAPDATYAASPSSPRSGATSTSSRIRAVDSQLWTSDGTVSGTVPDIPAGARPARSRP